MTPLSPANWFEFDIEINCSHSVVSEVIVAVFRDSELDAIACGVGYVAANNEPTQVSVKARVQALTAAARTFAVRIGGVNAGTLTINGASGNGKLNATLLSHVAVREIWG